MISGCLSICIIFSILLSPFLVLASIITGKGFEFNIYWTPIVIIMTGVYIYFVYMIFFEKRSSNSNEEKNKSSITDKYTKGGEKIVKQQYKAKKNNSFIE